MTRQTVQYFEEQHNYLTCQTIEGKKATSLGPRRRRNTFQRPNCILHLVFFSIIACGAAVHYSMHSQAATRLLHDEAEQTQKPVLVGTRNCINVQALVSSHHQSQIQKILHIPTALQVLQRTSVLKSLGTAITALVARSLPNLCSRGLLSNRGHWHCRHEDGFSFALRPQSRYIFGGKPKICKVWQEEIQYLFESSKSCYSIKRMHPLMSC